MSEKDLLSKELIVSAVNGDKVAIEKIVEIYSKYIDKLATYSIKLSDGSIKKYIDEDKKQYLILELIESIRNFKI